MECAECGALLLDFEMEEYNDLCADCYMENYKEGGDWRTMIGTPLKNPYPNGLPVNEQHILEPYVDLLNELRDKISKGEKVYIRITSGERKDSIAYIHGFDPDYPSSAKNSFIQMKRMFRDQKAYIVNDSINVILGWHGRRNRIKWSTNYYCEYLPEHIGNTVWKKFDRKKAEKKMLEETPVLDREGNTLKVGDRVLYINARYGSGASLDRGIIEEIKYKVRKTSYQDRNYTEVNIIIKNDNGSQSKIKTPRLSVLKEIQNV